MLMTTTRVPARPVFCRLILERRHPGGIETRQLSVETRQLSVEAGKMPPPRVSIVPIYERHVDWLSGCQLFQVFVETHHHLSFG